MTTKNLLNRLNSHELQGANEEDTHFLKKVMTKSVLSNDTYFPIVFPGGYTTHWNETFHLLFRNLTFFFQTFHTSFRTVLQMKDIMSRIRL